MLPILYHAHHSRHLEDIPFWLKLARDSPGPVLELGCGTGRVFLPLLQDRHTLVGLDHDLDMLNILRSNIPEALWTSARLIQADFGVFRLALEFGLVLLACNTYSTLSSIERQRLLACVRKHLGPGGIFAASIPNPLLLKHLPRQAESEIEEIFPHPKDGEPVQVSSEWKRDSQSVTFLWHYDHLLPQGSVERLSVQTQHYLDLPAAYQAELYSSGFTNVQMFGDYDKTSFSPSAPYLIFQASL